MFPCIPVLPYIARNRNFPGIDYVFSLHVIILVLEGCKVVRLLIVLVQDVGQGLSTYLSSHIKPLLYYSSVLMIVTWCMAIIVKKKEHHSPMHVGHVVFHIIYAVTSLLLSGQSYLLLLCWHCLRDRKISLILHTDGVWRFVDWNVADDVWWHWI